MKKNKNCIICFLLLLVTSTAFAGNDSIYQSIDSSMHLPDKHLFTNVYANPAAMFNSPLAYDKGRVAVELDYAKRDKLHLLHEGHKENGYRFVAEGTSRKDNKLFWGKASYSNYKVKGVQWSDVMDEFRLGPYHVADSIGGDKSGEEYLILGGVALQHKQWVFAAEVGYTAGIEFRRKDPRPKVTRTDLHAKLSLSYQLYKDYQLGITGEAGNYNQRVSILTKKSNEKYAFFAMRGFGQYQVKESTYDVNYSWLYKGTNYGASLFFLPKATGLVGNVAWKHESINSETGMIRIPFTFKTDALSADLGWQQLGTKHKTMVKLSYNYQLGTGTERTYYKQKINESLYQDFLLSAHAFYKRELTDISVEGLHQWIGSRSVKWIRLQAGTSEYEERYLYPVQKLNVKHLLSAIELGGEFRTSKRSTFVPRIQFSYMPLLSSTEDLIEIHFSEQAYKPNVEVLKADLMGIQAALTYEYRLKGNMQAFVSANADYQRDSNRNKQRYGVAIGVKY